ncbi:MAG: ArnT family glycosyltransferase [Acidimicrobiales bacterium]
MTSISDRAATAKGGPDAAEEPRPSDQRAAGADAATNDLVLTAGEAVAVTAVGLVAAIATWSLALAQLGRHDGWSAVALGVVTTAGAAALAVAIGRRPRIRIDRAELGLLAVVVVAGAFFFLPGFHYAWDDKDPGVYVAHGFAIAREGDVIIDDPVLQRGITPAFDLGGRFPGLWVEPDHPTAVTSQFYHLHSALLATAHDLGGPRWLFNLNPVLAIGSLCLIVLAVRRAVGTLAAGLSGALLVTSMMQVWQAKYQSTEILAQLLVAGALLAGVLAIERRWAAGGFVAGTLAGIGFLARPDGFLYVLVAGGIVGLALAADRFDRRAWGVIGGLALTLPYAYWNAYDARQIYSEANNVPSAAKVTAALIGMVGTGLVTRAAVRAIRRRTPASPLADPRKLIERWQLPLGLLICLMTGVGLTLLFFRPDIWGEDYEYLGLRGAVGRSFDEMNTQWLAWFVTIRGLVVMWLGICVAVLRRWRASLLTLTLPGTALLLLYLYDANVSMRLMWWVRRFIPAVLPTIVILVALGLWWLLTRRVRIVQFAGALLAISLIVEYSQMSFPLRDHDEMGGSWDMAAAIAAQAGDQQGVFLFPAGSNIFDINRNAPGIVWLVFDQVAARLPADYGLEDLQRYQTAFPDQPVFLVTPGTELPAQLPDDRFSESGAVTGSLSVWEETQGHRPSKEIDLPMGVTVRKLEPAMGSAE